MMKKPAVLLLAVILLFSFVPATAAQRSLDNPSDSFSVPEMNAGLFQKQTRKAGMQIVANILQQLFIGNADQDTVMKLMAQAPVVKKGDALPPQKELDTGNFMDMLTSGTFGSIYVCLHETDMPDIYRFMALYELDGTTYYTNIGEHYDAVNGRFFNIGGGDGLFGLGYEYVASNFLLRTDSMNSWHRKLGYSIFFDIFSPVVGTFLDTLRFPFEYNGKDYQIQIWRGVYSWFSNGGEIGIYEKESGKPIFWDCSDTTLDLSMQVYRGGKLFFDYGTQHTWWVGGFRFGSPIGMPVTAPNKVHLSGSIKFEDEAMLNAFMASFESAKKRGMTGKADGMTFTFDWPSA